MKILVVDDCWMSMRGYLAQYSPAHYEYEGATNPAEAEAVLQKFHPDILLLDGDLLVQESGPDALRRWKTEGRALPPVYMISSSEKSQQEGVAAGAVGTIDKDDIPTGLKALE